MILESIFNFSNKNEGINRDVYSQYFYDNIDSMLKINLFETYNDLMNTIENSDFNFTSKNKLK